MFKFIAISALISIVIYFGLALGLLLSQRPQNLSATDSISFNSVAERKTRSAVPLISTQAGDGSAIWYRHFPNDDPSAPLVIVIHGSGWHGGGYLDLAGALSATGAFEVLVPDLRGHGTDPIRRGDVDYIGQFEDDLATLITAHGGQARNVAMVGHSSGGGLVIRFAGGKHGALLDRAVLMAPYLHHNAPTARKDTGGWAHPLFRRIIGLSMLNNVGITAFNGLEIIQFNFPKAVLEGAQGQTATQSYTYRLNTSFAPRPDYLADIAKLPEFLLIAGQDDDAFHAAQYEPTVSAATDQGQYRLLPGVDHIGITADPYAMSEIVTYLSRPF